MAADKKKELDEIISDIRRLLEILPKGEPLILSREVVQLLVDNYKSGK